MGPVITGLAVACAATILLECLPALFLDRKKDWIKAGLVCNVVTNPILNLLLVVCACFTDSRRILFLLVLLLETAVVFAEAWIYRNMLEERFTKCLTVSLIANAFSFLTGLLLQ